MVQTRQVVGMERERGERPGRCKKRGEEEEGKERMERVNAKKMVEAK